MPLIYSLEISDEEIALMEHFVANAKEWIDAAISGKIENCRKRIIKSEIDKAIEAATPIPSTAQEIVGNFLSAKDYKSRKQRDIEDTSAFKNDGGKINGEPS